MEHVLKDNTHCRNFITLEDLYKILTIFNKTVDFIISIKEV